MPLPGSHRHPPGLFPGVTYDEYSFQLAPGDAVLFCTDGLTYAHDARDEEFGAEGIPRACSQHAGETLLDPLGHIFRAIEEFTRDCRQWDDIRDDLSLRRALIPLQCRNGQLVLLFI